MAGREDRPVCAVIEHRMEEVMKYSDNKVTDLNIAYIEMCIRDRRIRQCPHQED